MIEQRIIDHNKLRTARGKLTMTDVGNRIGVTRQQIWGYENGKNLPSVEKMVMLLKLYDLKLENILTNEE